MSNYQNNINGAKSVPVRPVSKYRRAAGSLILAIMLLQNLLIAAPTITGAAITPAVPAQAATTAADQLVSANIVISQVYGGGGNAGAQFNNDFVELFNRGTAPVSVAGWSIQYASATGTTWATTPLTGTINPGRYYLVQEGAGANTPAPLPAPDATGTIAMSATNGKVALSNASTALTGSCPSGASVIDFVGFGSANCFEGTAPTPVLSNTTAAIRGGGGCTETDQNQHRFYDRRAGSAQQLFAAESVRRRKHQSFGQRVRQIRMRLIPALQRF